MLSFFRTTCGMAWRARLVGMPFTGAKLTAPARDQSSPLRDPVAEEGTTSGQGVEQPMGHAGPGRPPRPETDAPLRVRVRGRLRVLSPSKRVHSELSAAPYSPSRFPLAGRWGPGLDSFAHSGPRVRSAKLGSTSFMAPPGRRCVLRRHAAALMDPSSWGEQAICLAGYALLVSR